MKRAFLTLLYKLYTLQFIFTRPITMGVRVLLVRDGQVLLVKHIYQPYWYLPGGAMKRGETPEQAARREAFEEAGASLGEIEFFGVFSQFIENRSDHILVFACENFTFTGKSDFEIESVQLFPIHSLPEDIAPGNKRRIEEYLQGSQVKAGKW